MMINYQKLYIYSHGSKLQIFTRNHGNKNPLLLMETFFFDDILFILTSTLYQFTPYLAARASLTFILYNQKIIIQDDAVFLVLKVSEAASRREMKLYYRSRQLLNYLTLQGYRYAKIKLFLTTVSLAKYLKEISRLL